MMSTCGLMKHHLDRFTRGVGQEEIRHMHFDMKPGLKHIFCFTVHKGLPST